MKSREENLENCKLLCLKNGPALASCSFDKHGRYLCNRWDSCWR